MSNLRKQKPRQRKTRRVPAYPRLIALGAIALAAACSGVVEVDAETDEQPHTFPWDPPDDPQPSGGGAGPYGGMGGGGGYGAMGGWPTGAGAPPFEEGGSGGMGGWPTGAGAPPFEEGGSNAGGSPP